MVKKPPLSLRSESSPAAGIEDVGGTGAAVSDSAVGAGDGSTELTGNDSAVILQTNAHSGDKGQFMESAPATPLLTMSPPPRRRKRDKRKR